MAYRPIPAGRLVGLIGPDGVGKSSLLAILAGARQIQSGGVLVLGAEMADVAARATICPRIAYMPQGLGKNLYPDLSVRENIEFFGRLFGQSREEREWRIAELLDGTGLAPFADRPAKKLSGGMRQKLGLCCALIHDPDLLILDEPTTGVDPLSRRQFWELIDRIRAAPARHERHRRNRLHGRGRAVRLAGGHERRQGSRRPASPLESEGADAAPARSRMPSSRCFRTGRSGRAVALVTIPPRAHLDAEPVIVARELTRRFGDFTAVDHVSFTIERGEIFGFLGSNGCGKTTTMKMLTGLLPPSDGEALLFGRPVDASDLERAAARRLHVAVVFALYRTDRPAESRPCTRACSTCRRTRPKARIAELVERFESCRLSRPARLGDLPLGIRQRLSLAVAVVHEPEMLILDEPTSGVDPLARDRFWELLIDLSRNHGVTIFVSTHFMNEAERCDRISLMDAGRVLATDTPAGLVKATRRRHPGRRLHRLPRGSGDRASRHWRSNQMQ